MEHPSRYLEMEDRKKGPPSFGRLAEDWRLATRKSLAERCLLGCKSHYACRRNITMLHLGRLMWTLPSVCVLGWWKAFPSRYSLG
ncbi:hypothetical protein Q31a_40700 [Aureliella helgolandensis]|uniref:Uncharacterized protein n=1 Tax=Aureliella helgolandensis TaxID=2527968 RepID=A0A518GB01_9BACT|nr:hypothetical protein Q31a_40700 [Aureliella helgolandensis]